MRTMHTASAGSSETSLTRKPSTLRYVLRGSFNGSTAILTTTRRSTRLFPPSRRFDSTKRLYPGMRDRAYFSARAILQMNVRARVRSQDHASKYPIPAIPADSADSFQDNDPDLFHLIHMLVGNLNASKPVLLFPDPVKNTRIHSLWLSNLFVDLVRAGPIPIMRFYKSYLTIAETNHQAMIANTLLVWYMILGGHVEEETTWAVDKSYAVISSLLPTCLILCTSVIRWKPSSPTYLQEWWTPLPMEIAFNISGASSNFWQRGSSALRV